MEELLKEENNLIDKLNNEITKVKENLYNNFSKIADEIKTNERINKYMKMMGQKEKNIFKKLTIISNMEKNIKEMKKINNDKIKSIKIKFIENNNDLEINEYYINDNEIYEKKKLIIMQIMKRKIIL